MAIEQLIIPQDFHMIAKDLILAILHEERDSQMAKAEADGKDPSLWFFEIYNEETDRMEEVIGSSSSSAFVNVWTESIRYEQAGSTSTSKFPGDARIWIDCYALGKASKKTITEDVEGVPTEKVVDVTAAVNAMSRCVWTTSIIRNIIMAAQYQYLSMKGTIAKRWVSDITFKHVEAPRSTPVMVVGCVSIYVNGQDTSPQVSGQTLESFMFRYDNIDPDLPPIQEITYNA